MTVAIEAPCKAPRDTPDWRCPNCNAKLAEIVGERVVIRMRNRRLSLPAIDDIDQVCWRCGVVSVLGDVKPSAHALAEELRSACAIV